MILARPLVIAGPSAAGKTTLATMLADLLDTDVVNSGDLLRAHLSGRGVTLRDELETGGAFLDRFGEQEAGEVIERGARHAGASIIDGVRLFSSLDAFSRAGSDPRVIVLSANREIRLARLVAMLTKAAVSSPEREADEILTGKGVWEADLPQFARVAEWSFTNEGTLGALAEFARSIAPEAN